MANPGPWPRPQQGPPPAHWQQPYGWAPGSPARQQWGGYPQPSWHPYPGHPGSSPNTPPRRSRFRRILGAIFGTLVVLVAGIGAYAYWHDHERAKQVAEIRKVINQFADASDTADTKKMATLMCREEAAQFTSDVPNASDVGPIVPGQRQAVEIAYVVIKDDTAMVGVTRPPLPTVNFDLKRENGTWKLCNA